MPGIDASHRILSLTSIDRAARYLRPGFWGRLVAAGGGAATFVGCAGSPSTVDARGTGAADIAGLWWWALALGLLVLISVVAILIIKIIRNREPSAEATPGEPGNDTWIVLGGVAIPAVILVALLIPGLLTLNTLSGEQGDKEIVIDVTGYQWWWEVRYPNQGVTTANEIHIPVGRPIQVNLRSADVIHSFWVPQLAGKIDVFPDRPTSLVLEATQPGTYRGECAEFCGIDHANMGFLVFADSPAQFDAWLKGQEQPAAAPSDPQPTKGQQVFLTGKCVECHTIRGTPANGKAGPDLTHFGSRTMFAGNTYPNNPGFLGGWIIDSQKMKPDNKMPPNPMSGADLQALLAYLAGLR